MVKSICDIMRRSNCAGALQEAQTIEDAIYDLKAVNPNRITKTDRRTPSELLDIIATAVSLSGGG